MNEYVIATDDVTELMRHLAMNVIGEIETKLLISNGQSTATVWFTPQEASSKGFTGTEVFYGLASLESNLPITDRTPARIQMESRLLIFIADL